MQRAVLVAAVFFLLAGGSAARVSQQTRLVGVVERGPTMPVCLVDDPCTAPAIHATVVFTRGDRVAARATTNTRGAYAVRLAPGRYAVRVTIGKMNRPPEPRIVRVRAVRVQVADFFVDTGIR